MNNLAVNKWENLMMVKLWKSIKINIKEVKNGFEKVFTTILNGGVDEIEVPEDFYWNIDESEKYNIDLTPVNLDIGQLSDDYSELLKINSGESDQLAYALVWLSSLARVIGENKVV